MKKEHKFRNLRVPTSDGTYTQFV